MNHATMKLFARSAAHALDSEQIERLQLAAGEHRYSAMRGPCEYEDELDDELIALGLIKIDAGLIRATDIGRRILSEIDIERWEQAARAWDDEQRRPMVVIDRTGSRLREDV